MIVYKQNVGDVCRELTHVLGDMETLAKMYALDPPRVLRAAIVDTRHAREMLIDLHTTTCRVEQINHIDDDTFDGLANRAKEVSR